MPFAKAAHRTSHRFLLLIAGAVCYASSFPPLELRFLAWFAPFFWLLMISGLAGWRRFQWMFAAGYLTCAGTIFWLWHLFSFLALLLYLIPALYFGVWGWLSGLRISFIPRWIYPAWPAVVWCGAEHLRGEWAPMSFSWMSLGYTQFTGIGPLAASVAGIYGLSGLMVLWSAVLLQSQNLPRRYAAVLVPLLILAPVSSFIPHWKQDYREFDTVTLQQLKENDEIENWEQAQLQHTTSYLILWPEYTLPDDPFLRENSWFRDIITSDTAIATGGVAFGAIDYPTDNKHRGAPFRNTIYLLNPAGEVLARAVKNQPIQLMNDGLPADSVSVVPLPASTLEQSLGRPLNVGIGICYDGSFQQYARQMVVKGADVLCFPTYNAEIWGAVQHRQHQRMFQMRAAETGRTVLVAATSGPTFAANPGGTAQEPLPFHKTESLRAKISLPRPTIFNSGGWIIGPLSTIIVCAVSLIIICQTLWRTVVQKFRPRRFRAE